MTEFALSVIGVWACASMVCVALALVALAGVTLYRADHQEDEMTETNGRSRMQIAVPIGWTQVMSDLADLEAAGALDGITAITGVRRVRAEAGADGGYTPDALLGAAIEELRRCQPGLDADGIAVAGALVAAVLDRIME